MKNEVLPGVFNALREVSDCNNVPDDCCNLILRKYERDEFQFNGLSKSAAKRRANRLNCCLNCGKSKHGDSKCKWSNTHAQQDLVRFCSLGAIRLNAERLRPGSQVESIVEDEISRIKYHLVEKAGLLEHPISKLG